MGPPAEHRIIADSGDAPGLSRAEAALRLVTDGANSVGDAKPNAAAGVLANLWAPVPWMLEAAILLQLGLRDYAQAGIVFGLLVFNAVLGYFQSARAQATLDALESRLALEAPVRRGGTWTIEPAAALVRGDIIKLSLGGIVAADATILDGEVQLDQSMLTGESLPVEAVAGAHAFAGALIRRGEAVATVTATGPRTKFGRTAELIRSAHVVSTQQKAVLAVVRNLALFNGIVVLGLQGYSLHLHLPGTEIVALVLTAILASIPVALPATFTLASAVGARHLAALGVLPTRLSAVDEAASIDVLCCDKTGTLTENALKVETVWAMPGFDASHVLMFAALASSDGGEDVVDAAIRRAAAAKLVLDRPRLATFVPFDPRDKMSSATFPSSPGHPEQRAIKGAFGAVSALASPEPSALAAAESFERSGNRVLAVAVGDRQTLRLAGLIALSDPPRADAKALVTELAALGVNVVMVTGDAAITAAAVAASVGIAGAVYADGALPENVVPERYGVYAGVLPEDKFRLIRAFQKMGHIVGMCGDGVNDAPALRQAQTGIAVVTATDVAKSAAGIVLTTPGLEGIVAAVKEGRIIFQRVLRYTLNSIMKKTMMVLFLAIGLIATGHAVLTPMLMVVLMVIGDFLAMSFTTDNVRPSPRPNAWQIGALTIAGVTTGFCLLSFCCATLWYGVACLALPAGALQTLSFVAIAFGSQAAVYALRDRRQVVPLCPSRLLVLSSICDIVISATLAARGILMAPLPLMDIAAVFVAAIVFALVLNICKVPMFRKLGLA